MASFDVHKFMELDTTNTRDWGEATSLLSKVENEIKEIQEKFLKNSVNTLKRRLDKES